MVHPSTVQETAAIIRDTAAAGRSVAVRGGGTKSSMGTPAPPNALVLDTTGLIGVIEYVPGELTFTAAAGISLREVITLLAEHGQYLPFDPLFVDANPGATLGGTIGAGLSGPRRLRYGGLRDFILGIQYLDSSGTLIKSGGKVVKNAAGYDYPKLFCGSLGTLGIITQASFKVFPRPQTSQTLLASLPSIEAVQEAFQAVLRSKAEVSAADAWPANTIDVALTLNGRYSLAVQVDGLRESIAPRLEMIRKALPKNTETQQIDGDNETQLWETLRDVRWAAESGSLLRFYLAPDQLAALDHLLARTEARRVYSLGGNSGWGFMMGDPTILSAELTRLGIRAAVWRTDQANIPEILPAAPAAGLAVRVKRGFDPKHVFYPARYGFI